VRGVSARHVVVRTKVRPSHIIDHKEHDVRSGSPGLRLRR
jgi:hypothetical protein